MLRGVRCWVRRCGQWIHIGLPWCHVTVSRWGVYVIWNRHQAEHDSIMMAVGASFFVALVALMLGVA